MLSPLYGAVLFTTELLAGEEYTVPSDDDGLLAAYECEPDLENMISVIRSRSGRIIMMMNGKVRIRRLDNNAGFSLSSVGFSFVLMHSCVCMMMDFVPSYQFPLLNADVTSSLLSILPARESVTFDSSPFPTSILSA